MAIDHGTPLQATTASGDTAVMRAVGAPTKGRDFTVVWVCTPEEFDRAVAAGDEPDAIPWPLDAVVELELA